MSTSDRSTIPLAVVACLIILGLGVTCLVLISRVSAETGDSRCPASASVCIYHLPDDIEAARSVCFRAEREARDIPGDRDAYIAWYEAHRGTPAQADWDRAYQRCKDLHELPGGKWAWDQMIYVGSR